MTHPLFYAPEGFSGRSLTILAESFSQRVDLFLKGNHSILFPLKKRIVHKHVYDCEGDPCWLVQHPAEQKADFVSRAGDGAQVGEAVVALVGSAVGEAVVALVGVSASAGTSVLCAFATMIVQQCCEHLGWGFKFEKPHLVGGQCFCDVQYHNFDMRRPRVRCLRQCLDFLDERDLLFSIYFSDIVGCPVVRDGIPRTTTTYQR
jgi:hypothetical protein